MMMTLRGVAILQVTWCDDDVEGGGHITGHMV